MRTPYVTTWTREDILVWLGTLGHTRDRQRRVVQDLLINGKSDRMTSEDRAVCCRALVVLRELGAVGPTAEAGGPRLTRYVAVR